MTSVNCSYAHLGDTNDEREKALCLFFNCLAAAVLYKVARGSRSHYGLLAAPIPRSRAVLISGFSPGFRAWNGSATRLSRIFCRPGCPVDLDNGWNNIHSRVTATITLLQSAICLSECNAEERWCEQQDCRPTTLANCEPPSHSGTSLQGANVRDSDPWNQLSKPGQHTNMGNIRCAH